MKTDNENNTRPSCRLKVKLQLTDASAFPKASPVCELLAPELCARLAATHTHTCRGKEGGSLVNKVNIVTTGPPGGHRSIHPTLSATTLSSTPFANLLSLNICFELLKATHNLILTDSAASSDEEGFPLVYLLTAVPLTALALFAGHHRIERFGSSSSSSLGDRDDG